MILLPDSMTIQSNASWKNKVNFEPEIKFDLQMQPMSKMKTKDHVTLQGQEKRLKCHTNELDVTIDRNTWCKKVLFYLAEILFVKRNFTEFPTKATKVLSYWIVFLNHLILQQDTT